MTNRQIRCLALSAFGASMSIGCSSGGMNPGDAGTAGAVGAPSPITRGPGTGVPKRRLSVLMVPTVFGRPWIGRATAHCRSGRALFRPRRILG